jgi:hypothetical protein
MRSPRRHASLKRWPCPHDAEKEPASAYHVRTVVTMVPLPPRPGPLQGSPCLGPCSDTPILTTLSRLPCWIKIIRRSNVHSRAMLRLLYEKSQWWTGANAKPLPRTAEGAR